MDTLCQDEEQTFFARLHDRSTLQHIKAGAGMKTKLLLLAFMACCVAGPVWADSGADILKAPVVPRAVAMGGAYVAAGDDVNSIQYNPAGLARIRKLELSLSHSLGQFDSLEYVAICNPIKAGGTLGASFIFRHMPDISNDGAADAPVKSEDLVVGLDYALKLNYLSTSLEEWAAGVNVKWIKSTLGDYSPTTVAGDIGILWTPAGSLEGLRGGLSVQNIGSAITYIAEADPLPLTARVGLAYPLLSDASNKLTVAADYEHQLVNQKGAAHVGAEYWLMDMIALRAGYQYQADSLASVIYGGLGFQFVLNRTRLQADYAFKPVIFADDKIDAEHFISLTLAF
jgi:hypothetical protein